MALVQPIKDGKLVDTSSSSLSDSSKKTNSNSSLDKQAFLQLLVAQMKYQDPLEPTSNTEYIAQLATFSQLEATQNLQSSYEQSQASSLVGKPVIMKTTSKSTGDTYSTVGYVDAVMMSNGKPYLYINSNYYSLSDLDTVLDEEYFKEYLKSIEDSTTGTDDTKTDDTKTDDTKTDDKSKDDTTA
ncbi:flagellar hook assembly protein FlgD [Candidatus Galacturonibacter soehngenii]|uniref:Flagellar hook capping protein n=1 Tax=Candidatus Galacturonatibacter soehngenii TaxID=2307010 RepID=A0A7V7UB86_9FIRM|nr:flagellar hook capping FlgD N-terminal domain-containing protein [Candidatus Galacturonibacter soehngenii]KAB1437705.1 flagellar hook capping protein [Candidatus Galacturonibacter soehngenii]MBA4686936.1 flagellar hook capping protein [Candidatus Galacturonibacter soehngenii]